MMLFRPKIRIETARMILRLPEQRDYNEWYRVRDEGQDFLLKWEPVRGREYSSRKAFRNRVYWSAKSATDGRALPLFLIDKETGQFMGALTLDNIRRGPAQMANIGYWDWAGICSQGIHE